MSAILEALPDAVRQGDRQNVIIDQRVAVEQARLSRDWAESRRQLLADYETKLKPLIQAHPSYRIQYFGTAPIPLMMLLGFKVDTWRGVATYHHHHVRKNWKWGNPDGPALDVKIDLDQIPKKPSLAEGDVVVRVAVSYPVDPRLTQAVVFNPLAEIDISVDIPALDIIESSAGVDAVAGRFREALDAVQTKFPNARAMHVFAAVPPGVAFRMGTVISSTMHTRIQAYELDRAGAARGYYPTFILQETPQPKLIPTPAEAEALACERTLWQAELERLRWVAGQLPEQSKTWIYEIESSCAEHLGLRWASLPSVRALRGIDAQVDMSAREVNDSFELDHEHGRWKFDDEFLLSILRRIPDEGERRCAIRLFLLHESVHDHQVLTRGTAAGIGRFGKVLEEADYQADTWALLYEYRYRATAIPADVVDSPRFFCGIVGIAMETMMAFDDAGGDADEMQARRIARYLIWAWQYVELERSRTLADCFAILCEKPVIDVVGLRTRLDDRRIMCSLRPELADRLEIAILRRSRLDRYGLGGAARIDLILQSLRQHKPDDLRSVLRAISDLVLSPRKT